MTCPRQEREKLEKILVGDFCVRAADSRGRRRAEEEDPVRTCFQRDADRITHSKAFRRLKHKTQVFLQPEGDHYRTRLTHTLEVTRLARTVGRALRLNEDLCEAIALGHDLGHTPFGHAGERALNEIYGPGFRHYEQSLRVVDKLERGGTGLNLTYEVRMGILGHSSHSRMPETLEGQIVRKSDQIAYINHDIDDAIRALVLTEDDIPLELRKTLGFSTKQRLNTLIHNIIMNSREKDDIMMSPEIEEAMIDLRKFMFENVYKNPVAKGEEVKAKAMIEQLFYFYKEHLDQLPAKYLRMMDEGESAERVVADYIAGMTDQYAITKFSEYFLPQAWQVDGY